MMFGPGPGSWAKMGWWPWQKMPPGWWQKTPGGGFAWQYPPGQVGIPYGWYPGYGLVQ